MAARSGLLWDPGLPQPGVLERHNSSGGAGIPDGSSVGRVQPHEPPPETRPARGPGVPGAARRAGGVRAGVARARPERSGEAQPRGVRVGRRGRRLPGDGRRLQRQGERHPGRPRGVGRRVLDAGRLRPGRRAARRVPHHAARPGLGGREPAQHAAVRPARRPQHQLRRRLRLARDRGVLGRRRPAVHALLGLADGHLLQHRPHRLRAHARARAAGSRRRARGVDVRGVPRRCRVRDRTPDARGEHRRHAAEHRPVHLRRGRSAVRRQQQPDVDRPRLRRQPRRPHHHARAAARLLGHAVARSSWPRRRRRSGSSAGGSA